jgi:hypothetical protein
MASLIKIKQTCLSLLTHQLFIADDVCKPIDTSLLDMGGSGSTRSEDIALA